MPKNDDEILAMARAIADEIWRQNPGAMDLSEGDLTRFLVFEPINLVALASALSRPIEAQR